MSINNYQQTPQPYQQGQQVQPYQQGQQVQQYQ